MAEIHYFDKEVKSVALTKKNLNRTRHKKVWIDLQMPSDYELELIKSRFKIHPTTIEDIKTHNTRIKIEEFRRYLFIVMYDLSNINNQLELHEINIILGKGYLITIHPHKLEEFGDELNQLKANKKRLLNHFLIGTDRILHDIMDKVVAHYFPIMDKLNDEIDDLEEIVADNADRQTLTRIIEIRKKIVLIKKIINPQKEKIAFLAKIKHISINQGSMPYFRDLNDDITKLSEMNESFRETVKNIYETYMSTISYNMNDIIKILSIISTIMLPLTFITGLFGMNFEFIPGLRDHRGFWLSIGLMIIVAIGMLFFFHRKKWI